MTRGLGAPAQAARQAGAGADEQGGHENAAAWEAFQRAKQTVAEGDSLLAAGSGAAAMTMLARADTALGAVGKMDTKWVAPPAQQGLLNYRLAVRALGSGAGVAAVQARIDAGLASAERALALVAERRGCARGARLAALLPVAAQPRAAGRRGQDARVGRGGSRRVDQGEPRAGVGDEHAQSPVSLHGADPRWQPDRRSSAYKADPYLSDINKTVFRLFRTSLDLNNGQQAKQWCDEGARRFPNDFRFVECRLWLLTLPDPQPPPTADQIWKAIRRRTWRRTRWTSLSSLSGRG